MTPRGLWAALALTVGWGFVGVGLFAWARRPDNRVGMLMTATGFAWFVGVLGSSDIAVLFTFGQALGSLYFATAIHMLLAAPTGRLQSRAERRIVIASYGATLAVVPFFLFADPKEGFDCADCPENVLLVHSYETFVQVASVVINVVGLLLVIAVLVSLIRRWRRASAPERRLYGPVYGAGIAMMLALIAVLVSQSTARESEVESVAFLVTLVPLALMPYLFLASLVRARMIQGGAVGELIARLGEAPRPGELREALARALGDSSLELVYWLPEDERFVDAEGSPYEVPPDGSGRSVTRVEREGDCIAAIVYDSSLREAEDHVRAVGAAAALALQNERLEAELRAKVQEVRASRERMLRIGLEERRRLERDLHDGAQQRLVSLALDLRLARAKLRDDPDAADRLLVGAGEELDAALEELRELARGIHPAVLTDRGLDTALETLARAGAGAGRARDAPGGAPAGGGRARRLLRRGRGADQRGQVRGGQPRNRQRGSRQWPCWWSRSPTTASAAPTRASGTGLRGLADRLAVLDGRLDVESEPRPRHDDQGEDPVRVVVADDSVLLREGIVRLLEERRLRGRRPGRRRRRPAAQGQRP